MAVGWLSRLSTVFAFSYDFHIGGVLSSRGFLLQDSGAYIGGQRLDSWHSLRVGDMVLASWKLGRINLQGLLTVHQCAPGNAKLKTQHKKTKCENTTIRTDVVINGC
jgi:hypothetical protein